MGILIQIYALEHEDRDELVTSCFGNLLIQNFTIQMFFGQILMRRNCGWR